MTLRHDFVMSCFANFVSCDFYFRVTLVSQVPGETQEGMENGYELSFIVQRLSLLYFYKRLITGCAHMKSSNSNINTKRVILYFFLQASSLIASFGGQSILFCRMLVECNKKAYLRLSK